MRSALDHCVTARRCLHISIHTYIPLRIHTHMHTCIHMHMHVYTQARKHTHTRLTHTHTHCTQTHTRTHTNTYTHAHAHARIHTHTHTHYLLSCCVNLFSDLFSQDQSLFSFFRLYITTGDKKTTRPTLSSHLHPVVWMNAHVYFCFDVGPYGNSLFTLPHWPLR